MERYYEIAGIRLQVSGPEHWMYTDHGVLSPFVVENRGEEAYQVTFEAVKELPAPRGELVFAGPQRRVYCHDGQYVCYIGTAVGTEHRAYVRAVRQGTHITAQCKIDEFPYGVTPKTVLKVMDVAHMVAHKHGFLLHASYIRLGDRAILFTAPSGTGKSTQADLWCRFRNAELINGDRAAVMVEDGSIFAWGIPFSGSSGVAKRKKLPLAAIVYLSQAADNTVVRLGGFRAFRKVWEGCSVNNWNRDDAALCSQTVLDTLNAVPVYHLACTPDETAVITLEAIFMQEGII